jgi:dipeptidyl aminopeptidase/acylaminoacyl peptidase
MRGPRLRSPDSPCGAWPSPLAAERVAAAGLRLAQPRLDRGCVYWLEGRPAEGGRGVVMRASLERAGEPEAVSDPSASVRTRVHEYGGGDYLAGAGDLFAVHDGDGAVHRRGPDGWRPLGGCAPGARHADLARSPDGRWLVAVEERERAGAEPRNALVALALDGAGRVEIDRQHDFVSSPCFSPDGTRLAWLAWNHPNMPWDGNLLCSLSWTERGPTGPARRVVGGAEESVFQPSFSPAGVLSFASDRSGWWNLYQVRAGTLAALCPCAAEFGRPQWVLGLSTYDFADEDALLCAIAEDGRQRLVRLDRPTGRLDEVPLPFTSIEGVRVRDGWACFLGAGPRSTAAVCALRLADGLLRVLRTSGLDLDPAWISEAEAITFRSAGGRRAHAFLYRPRHPGRTPAPGERPPLLVRAHGGPHAAASSALDGVVQFWTSRGFALVDVDYAGSSGYGRAYRRLLDGAWGVADVEDCLAAARHLVREGGMDPGRLAMRGSSAGGYTALCALVFHDLLQAGAIYYGIGDLEALARDTHKFEAHYLERLIGPYPARRALYLERSPLHAIERLSTPLILFQGLEDRVVPPQQARAIAEALERRGVPSALFTFEGEGHGFRRAESVATALEAELAFYGRVFGFEPEVRPEIAHRLALRT